MKKQMLRLMRAHGKNSQKKLRLRMMPNLIAKKGFRALCYRCYKLLDSFYIPLDKRQIFRTKNILRIPRENNRRGGRYSYAEWAHVIGIFQTLMFIHLDKKQNNRILDVGCGTGFLAIAAEPFLNESGCYVGIDIVKRDIEFCRKHYPSNRYSFIHYNAHNPMYSPNEEYGKAKWNLESGNFDLVTALSVWTHLNEEDALFYLKEVSNFMKPGSKAIITMFLLDETYEKSLSIRSSEISSFHMTRQDLWIFDKSAYGSNAWFYLKSMKVPEYSIGITTEGLNRLMSETGLQKVEHYPGNWKEVPGVFFQDIVVFQKV